ncbi:MAG: PQQ-dependent sugar dehydrogenase [Pirellulales bacterium]
MIGKCRVAAIVRRAIVACVALLAANRTTVAQDVLPTVPLGRSIQLELVATGLNAAYDGHSQLRSTDLVPVPDGSGRLVVAQLGGFANIVLPGGTIAPGAYLDLYATNPNFAVSNNGWGFTSLEFHPGFADPTSVGFGKFYTLETEPNRVTDVDFVSSYPPPVTQDHLDVFYEYTMDDITANTFSGTKRRLFTVRQPISTHNFNDMAFGQDGYLYVAGGDGGNSSSRPDGGFSLNSRRLDNAFGKVLRIDPIDPSLTPDSLDAISANGNYRIPADNPFVGDPDPNTPQDETLDEIYSYGHRNPYRITVDRQNGDMWVGDVGQNSIESVDRVVKGGDYGWSLKEGSFLYDTTNQNNITPDVDTNGDGIGDFAAANGLIDPVFEYGRQDGKSIQGGFVYRGEKIPWLRGMYVFGDNYANGTQLFYGDPATGEMHRFAILSTQQTLGSGLHAVGQDADGEILLATNVGGRVLRISCAASPVAGDVNGDGVVDRGDVASLVTSFGTADESNVCMGDLNGDGSVGLPDLAMLQTHLAPIAAAGPQASSAAVPEGSSVWLAMSAIAAVCCVSRRASWVRRNTPE